ncbi:MAG: rod shape-determining protein MreD [Planctomycetota bacterium]
MNPAWAAVTALVLAALSEALGGPAGFWTVAGAEPEPLLIFAVALGLLAPERQALWSAIALGALSDLSGAPVAETSPIVGPRALGYALAAWAILRARPLLVRDSWRTLALATPAAVILVTVVSVALLGLRQAPFFAGEPVVGGAGGYLLERMGDGLYTALLGVPLGWLLLRMRGVLGLGGRLRDRAY